jgi:hypothetical protein
MNHRQVIYSIYPKDCKKKSLEDNVYVTLREIFINCDSYEKCMRANYYSNKLTNSDRLNTENMTEVNASLQVLHEGIYLASLCNFLHTINPGYFAVRANEEETPTEFDIPFDEWWNDLEALKRDLQEELEKINAENVN